MKPVTPRVVPMISKFSKALTMVQILTVATSGSVSWAFPAGDQRPGNPSNPGQPGDSQRPHPGQPSNPGQPPQQPGQPSNPGQPPQHPGQPSNPGQPPQQPGQPSNPGQPPQQPGQPSNPGQPPVNTSQAERDGAADGQPDGGREGRERGQVDGREDGRREGYREGHERCEREEQRRAYDLGYSDGYRYGSTLGTNDGFAKGAGDGKVKGQDEGRADGEKRADHDSAVAAEPVGTAKGIADANSSDASARGTADGIVAGEKLARDQALQVDYPRGRQTYADEREHEAIQYNDSFSQLTGSIASAEKTAETTPSAGSTLKSFFQSVADSAKNAFFQLSKSTLSTSADWSNNHAGPDYRYSNPRRTYPSSQENEAYITAYRKGYSDGFATEYRTSHEFAFNEAHREGEHRGCEDARHQDYGRDYRRGTAAGQEVGYRETYQLAYDNAFRNAYQQAFPTASQEAYQANYNLDYDRHFEEARSEAYANRVGELYQTAHQQAQTSRYNEVYPQYAEQQYQLGRKDEEKEFAARPVRLLSASATETNNNSLFEPGEPLHVRLTLRNYAAGAVAGRDVTIRIEAMDLSSAVISQASSSLVRDLRQKSLTDVTDAFNFRMNESAVGRVSQFVITASYQGKNIGQLSIPVKAAFMIRVALAEQPVLKDGLAAPIRFRLTNESSLPSTAGTRVRFNSVANLLEIPQPEQAIAPLAAGESRIVEFSAIAHTAQPFIRIPLAVSVTESSGRRTGVLDLTDEVPVANDYRINLGSSPQDLLKAGITRLRYSLTNTGSRLLNKGLQLKVSFSGTDNSPIGSSLFSVIGPNPQYLFPLNTGETARFAVPVLVNSDNTGGVLTLEVQEDGRTVVVHRVEFGPSSTRVILK